MIEICFVCLGNICRSPIAEAVFRHLVAAKELRDSFGVDSAGTVGHHRGEPPDARARAAGERAGIPVSGRARQFVAADFARFQYVIAMDRTNVQDLQRLAPSPEAARKIRLLRSFDPKAPANAAVPDPYYGQDADFDEVLVLCRSACEPLLEEIRKEHCL